MLMALDFELERFWSLVLLLWTDPSAIFFAEQEGSPEASSEKEVSLGGDVAFWILRFCLGLDDQRTDQLTPHLPRDWSEGPFEFWVAHCVAGVLFDSPVWKETKSVPFVITDVSDQWPWPLPGVFMPQWPLTSSVWDAASCISVWDPGHKHPPHTQPNWWGHILTSEMVSERREGV